MGNCVSVQFSFENILLRCWDSTVGHSSYVTNLNETLSALSTALDKLRAQRSDLQNEVLAAERPGLKRLERVQLWLSTAQTMITEAEKLTAQGHRETGNLCLGGCASKTCLSTYKFGKQVAKMLQDINNHMPEAEGFNMVAGTQPPASVVIRPEERPIVALESTIDKLWSCIVDSNVGIIGLYGIGGVGKTTLLTQINNKFSTTQNAFDAVIWATVSKDYSVGKIQDEIGGKIGFSDESWKSKSVDQKAVDIYEVLLKKRFVLLLDDLWERVYLNKVGIPKPSQENGSKLIFTTRSFDVCGEMEARKKIEVECLAPEEAWNLFRDKVGDETLDSHPDIPKLAQQVAKECDGLPLALITIGRTMASKTTLEEWEYAIKKLKQSEFPKMQEKVLPLLKFSYDNLSDTKKRCLLYCCLYPEDYNILRKNLVEYWFCEGLLNENKFSEAQIEGYDIIGSLLSDCLLERAEEECVKMHDVIRDMGLWIACKLEAEREKYFVKAGAQLSEGPEVETWEGAKRMSLMQNRIEVLTGTPKCPNLQTMFLLDNKLQAIDNGFFGFMPNLTVLNMSDNEDLEALPEGISQLISLECLDLSSTGIRELPIELESLTKLKMLDLSNMSYLRKIPLHMISSFSKLQILKIWGIETNYSNGNNVLAVDSTENLIEELKSLQHLNILRIPPIRSVIDLEIFLSFHLLRYSTEALELRDFRETYVFDVLCLENMERLEILCFSSCEHMEEIKMGNLHTRVPPSTNYTSRFHTLRDVQFLRCDKLRDVTWLILAPNLRSLYIVNCGKMEKILAEGKQGEVADVVPTPFLKLETLALMDLPELKSIYWDALPFPCLKRIHVGGCPKLKKLPLNSDSAKGNHITIWGIEEHWWNNLEWENEATRDAFLQIECLYLSTI
ncbi:hypothetical protein V6N13_032743 [Hibiscus sabdariffa]|uniref:NB-ARC domain-containing protein n=1 Tax=Hibiscus sabdariffa TaxID=183260 RepID=A0ABR2FC69_9ROSI